MVETIGSPSTLAVDCCCMLHYDTARPATAQFIAVIARVPTDIAMRRLIYAGERQMNKQTNGQQRRLA